MNNKNHKSLLSLILPIYNEADSLPLLILELQKLLKEIEGRYNLELIFIDDGSTDESVAILTKYQGDLPLKIISFSRNFGHQAALLAGLKEAKGEVVVSLDSDLQHPPSFIPELLTEYEAGAEIVFTKRQDPQSLDLFKKLSSTAFYKILNFFSSTKIQEAGSDFRLMSRAAVDALLSLPETRVFLRGMVSWIGFKTKTLEFTAQPRQKGESKYSMFKMLRLAVFGISSFSTAPLYFSALIGLLLTFLAIMYGIYVLYVHFVMEGIVAGWSSVIFALLVIGSVLSFLLAILGIYVAALYDEAKRRPIYIIKQTESP